VLLDHMHAARGKSWRGEAHSINVLDHHLDGCVLSHQARIKELLVVKMRLIYLRYRCCKGEVKSVGRFIGEKLDGMKWGLGCC
jgi:hypothetical protein